MPTPRSRVERVWFRTPIQILITLLLAVVATGGHADAQSTTRGLLLGELLGQVQRANPRIAAARALANAARARVPAATRPPDPQLQFGFMNYTLPNLRPMTGVGMVQLQAMQMLPLGGKLELAGKAAGFSAEATSARALDVTWELRSTTAIAFYDLYSADRRLAVAREALRLLQDVEKIAEAMYRVGDGRQTDVLRAQVEIAKMVEDTIRMQAMRTAMSAKINALLARPVESRLDVPELPRFPDSVPSQHWLDSVADNDRPMIRAGRGDLRAAEASEKLTRKELWPDLQLGIQYGQRGGAMDTERMGSVMFGASLPVFARDRQLRMREEAAAMKDMASADLAAMRADTRARMAEAYASLASARTLDRLYRTTILPQAEAAAASALAAYRVGKVDFMTLLDDRMTVTTYRQELAALEAAQGKAWADLEMLTGRELIDVNRVASAPAVGGGDR